MTDLKNPQNDCPLFEELKTISQASFEHYKVPDAIDNVQTLADEICILGLHPERYNKLLIDTYDDTIIENINKDEII